MCVLSFFFIIFVRKRLKYKFLIFFIVSADESLNEIYVCLPDVFFFTK